MEVLYIRLSKIMQLFSRNVFKSHPLKSVKEYKSRYNITKSIQILQKIRFLCQYT